MHKVHAGYTVIAPFKKDGAEAAQRLLSELRLAPARMPFAQTSTTHFAQVSVIPAQPYGADELPATLLFATSFSGPADDHVADLVRVLGVVLRELFQHCEDFEPGCSDRALARFLRRHRRPDTFYSGMQHLSPEDVRRHVQLRSEIEAFVDTNEAALRGLDADVVQRRIQAHVRALPGFEWTEEPFGPGPGSFLAMHWRSLLLYAVVFPFLAALVSCSGVFVFCHHRTLGVVVASLWLALVAFLLFVAGLVWGVREAELAQRYVATRPPDELVRSLAATQNHPVINEMTVAGPIKEGTWRPLFLRMGLWIVARIAVGLPWAPFGLDEGINIPTVATARWITIDRGRRLIFISNFTNAAEPYVRDFIDTEPGAMRINLTFGFGGGYPRTDFVLLGGALFDPNAFIYVVATNQIHTDFWYCPYDDLSIDNIKRNRLLREGLFQTYDKSEARAWLHLL